MLNHSCLEVLTASSSFVEAFLCESLGLSPFQISIIKKYSRKMHLTKYYLPSSLLIDGLSCLEPLISSKVPFNVVNDDGTGFTHRLVYSGGSLIFAINPKNIIKNFEINSYLADPMNRGSVLNQINEMQKYHLCSNLNSLISQKKLFNLYGIPLSISSEVPTCSFELIK